MQRDVIVREAAGFERPVEWVVAYPSAVHAQEDALSRRVLFKVHVFSEPAFGSTAFVIVAAAAFLVKVHAGFKSVDIKIPHVTSNFIKTLDQLTVGHRLFPINVVLVLCQFPAKVLKVNHSLNHNHHNHSSDIAPSHKV